VIYIHIPFCKQACNYCDFHFATSKKYIEDLQKALLKEIRLRRDEIPDQISSIYFGGGTPSLLSDKQLSEILETIHSNFNVQPDAEITLEANPDDLNINYLKEIKNIGINRLSIGIQSFRERDLQFMNRAHSANEAANCTLLAADAGFKNMSVDLIYAIPGLSDEEWEQNIQIAAALPINHLSCYALTVEEKTPLAKQIKTGVAAAPEEDRAVSQFKILQTSSSALGYTHYEISNLAKPGFEAQHNSSYWSGKEYLGIGPSAHSFSKNLRRVNIPNNQKYISSLRDGDCLHETEIIDTKTRFHELVLTGFRTSRGISLTEITNLSTEYLSFFREQLEKHPLQKFISIENDHVKLSPEKWLLADGIAADFFY
jgi:oxygen-independent coproporphyrinogen III oxidase